jgi:hypothetical protein
MEALGFLLEFQKNELKRTASWRIRPLFLQSSSGRAYHRRQHQLSPVTGTKGSKAIYPVTSLVGIPGTRCCESLLPHLAAVPDGNVPVLSPMSSDLSSHILPTLQRAGIRLVGA